MSHSEKKPLILLAEDDANQRLLYSEELQDEGYEVVTASDGREALKLAEERRPDLIISDVNMPVMDGLDFMARLIEVAHGVPVILHTAYASYKDSFASWSAEAYVVKNSDLSELKLQTKRILEGVKQN